MPADHAPALVGDAGHPAATSGKCLGADRQSVLAQFGGVSPKTIIGREERAAGAFVVSVVEVVCRFDHDLRLFQTSAPWGVAPPFGEPPASDRSHTMAGGWLRAR